MSNNLPDFLSVCEDVGADENEAKLYHYIQELITTFNHAEEGSDITKTNNVLRCLTDMKRYSSECRANSFNGEKRKIFDMILGNKFVGNEAVEIIQSILDNNKNDPQRISNMLVNYQADRNAFLDNCEATRKRLAAELQ